MSDFDTNGLGGTAEGLNATLAETTDLMSGFDAELRQMSSTISATGQDVAALEKGLSKGLRKAFDGVVFDGMKLSDALRGVAQSLVSTTYNAAMKPVSSHFGGLLSQGIGVGTSTARSGSIASAIIERRSRLPRSRPSRVPCAPSNRTPGSRRCLP